MPVSKTSGFGPALEAFLRARGSGAVVTIATTFGYRVTAYLWRLETRDDGIVAVLTDTAPRFRATTEIVRLADMESVIGWSFGEEAAM